MQKEICEVTRNVRKLWTPVFSGGGKRYPRDVALRLWTKTL